MSAATQTGFSFYYTYKNVPLKPVSRGKAPVYRSHTRSEEGWSCLRNYDMTNFQLRNLICCQILYGFTLPSHLVTCPYRRPEGTFLKSGIKSYHYRLRIILCHNYTSNMAFVQLCGWSITSTTDAAGSNSQSKASYITLTSDISFKDRYPRGAFRLMVT
jgi:hypothetical protein